MPFALPAAPVVVASLDGPLLKTLEYAGVFVFALSGASVAARKQMDLVGVVALAAVTGIGGGVVRDVLLGSTPPTSLRTPTPLVLSTVAAPGTAVT